MNKSTSGGAKSATAAERVLDVIELLVDHPRGISLSDVSSKLSLPTGSTHRLLTGLVTRGYARHESDRDGYRLSMKLAALGFRFVSQTGLIAICQPVLDELATATGELVLMALIEDDRLIIVAKANGARRGLRYDADLGWEAVLHATATGRAWLVTLPEDEAVALIEQHGYAVPERYGRQKIKSSANLLVELSRTRQRGYGLSIDEGEDDSAAIAMAISPASGERSPGTITVAGSIGRVTRGLAELVPHLEAAVAEINALWPVLDSRLVREN